MGYSRHHVGTNKATDGEMRHVAHTHAILCRRQMDNVNSDHPRHHRRRYRRGIGRPSGARPANRSRATSRGRRSGTRGSNGCEPRGKEGSGLYVYGRSHLREALQLGICRDRDHRELGTELLQNSPTRTELHDLLLRHRWFLYRAGVLRDAVPAVPRVLGLDLQRRVRQPQDQ